MNIVDAPMRRDEMARGAEPCGISVHYCSTFQGVAQISEERYEFADFKLFPKQRVLLRLNDRVDIGGRAFDLLLLLVSRAGRVVSFRELMHEVWPNVTVEEANLRVQVCVVRRVLSQCEMAKRAIDSVSLRGYCFVLPVQHRDPAPGGYLQSQYGFPLLPDTVIGRDEAVQDILSALQTRRLITITGPAGIGKTTVAIAAAKRHATVFSGVISFVDLSRVDNDASPAQAIAKALQIPPSANATDALCERLRNRVTLLILDTCEHLVESIAELAEALLSHCANLKLIVTSRQILRATGEWTFRLPSLTFPVEDAAIGSADVARFSAVALFVDRMQSSTRMELSRPDLQIVAEICRRLDGIPLALEFAVARVGDLGLSQIAAQLNNCFAILTRGRRTAMRRQRTLTEALDWSYSRLLEDEQAMLLHLAGMGGTFTAAQAASSYSDGKCKKSFEALYGLYEKSLLMAELMGHEPVFRLLDITRIYVLQKQAMSVKPSRAVISNESSHMRVSR